MSTVTISRELAEYIQLVLAGTQEIPAEQLKPGELNISDLADELSRAMEPKPLNAWQVEAQCALLGIESFIRIYACGAPASTLDHHARDIQDLRTAIASSDFQLWQAMVREFHVKFGCKHADKPVSEMDLGTVALRNSLHEEEIKELRRAMLNVDLVEIADALADSIYVLLGTAVTYGIDLAPIFAEVHRTNMAKDGGATREDGKILKPEGWQPPDIAGLIEKQRGGK